MNEMLKGHWNSNYDTTGIIRKISTRRNRRHQEIHQWWPKWPTHIAQSVTHFGHHWWAFLMSLDSSHRLNVPLGSLYLFLSFFSPLLNVISQFSACSQARETQAMEVSISKFVAQNSTTAPTSLARLKNLNSNLSCMPNDTTKRLMSSPKWRSVEVINNPARPGSNHREVNCINYKQQ